MPVWPVHNRIASENFEDILQRSLMEDYQWQRYVVEGCVVVDWENAQLFSEHPEYLRMYAVEGRMTATLPASAIALIPASLT